MVTNLCPSQGNEQWCSYPANRYGYHKQCYIMLWYDKGRYGAHFDLMDYQMNGLISKLGWDNPEVTYPFSKL